MLLKLQNKGILPGSLPQVSDQTEGAVRQQPNPAPSPGNYRKPGLLSLPRSRAPAPWRSGNRSTLPASTYSTNPRTAEVKAQAFSLKLLLTVVFDTGRSCLKMWPHLSYDSRNKDRLKIYQRCSAPVIKASLNKQCSLSVKCTGLWTTIHFT